MYLTIYIVCVTLARHAEKEKNSLKKYLENLNFGKNPFRNCAKWFRIAFAGKNYAYPRGKTREEEKWKMKMMFK